MAYTYLIGWSKLNKWYYGVRFALKAKTEDLWTIYFTSSKSVKKFREQNGEPDIIEIRRIFEDTYKARLWETKVIRRMNAVSSLNWLNKTDNTNKFYHEGPRGSFSKEHKRKISEAKIGTKQLLETINKRISKNRGKKRTEQQILNLKNGQLSASEKKSKSMNGKKKDQNIP